MTMGDKSIRVLLWDLRQEAAFRRRHFGNVDDLHFDPSVAADAQREIEKIDYYLARTPKEIVDQWETRCFECNKPLGDFTIYVEDRDGKTFDGSASVLASFVVCSPRCLKRFAEDYGRP